MKLPLHVIEAAATTLRDEAVRNRRRRPETRVKLWMAAEQLRYRWLGSLLLARAMEKSDY